MRMPKNIGPFHIIGIGGIGMSAIAELMYSLGYKVRGSDMKESANVERLRIKGIPVVVGHKAENIEEAQYVIISTAVKDDNPELASAKEKGIPILRRAEILSELTRLYATISVTGTHGKTTTTSLTATLLEVGGIDPTVITGGIVQRWGTNARMGREAGWMVVEADESDGTFLKLPSTIGIVTNIDPEHLDHYGTFDDLKLAFNKFIENIPFYGMVVMCIDHPEVRKLFEAHANAHSKKRFLSYGFAQDADLKLMNLRSEDGKSIFDVEMSDKVKGGARKLTELVLPIPGDYNALNAIAAMAVAAETGISDEKIREGLNAFGGVNRRFTYRGKWNGMQIYDDYAHHPVEIEAVLNAARDTAKGRVIAVMQPHRYTRLKDLFEGFSSCFSKADKVLIAPVFEAGEKPIEGYNHETLVEGIIASGHADAAPLTSKESLTTYLAGHVQSGDLVICLGAGSITLWANELQSALEQAS